MQEALTIGIPTLAVLLGILLNRYDYGKLDTRMESRLSSFEGRMETRLSGVENRLHADVMLFIGKVESVERRLGQIENRS